MDEKQLEVQRLISKQYESFSLEEKKLIHTLYHSKNEDREVAKSQLRKIVFRMEPPTPAEFLDYRNGWITKAFAESIYPHVVEDFIEMLDPEKNYTQIINYGATRTGKSFCTRLVSMYTIIFIHCLRHPQLYYSLSPTTQLSLYIMCFNAEKVKQLLLKPIYNLLNSSPRFKQIKFQDKVKEEQYKHGLDIIYWSKAATFGEITLDSDLTINLGTDFMSFIGSDMLMLIISEIAFFIETTGATHEQIFQIYTDGLDRIKATVGNNYLGMVYLDTSANDTDNPIEKYILNLQDKENVFFKKRSRWEARPHMFPEWQKTGKTFKVFVGNNIYSPKLIESQKDLNELPPSLIIDVPIDVKDEFERNIIKSIKDIAGLPTIRESKFITNYTYINKIFENEYLKNIEGIIYSESFDEPEGLIWNQIKDKFFVKTFDNKYKIYRAQKEIRFVGLDLAHSLTGDVQGICVGHKEWSKKLETVMYIVDFAFAIGSKESAINLEAISSFIIDLVSKGNLAIKKVFSDQFQSATMIQFLNRNNITAERQSVDLTINPYQYFLTCIFNETIKSGKNIFLKNNLDSLLIVKNEKDKEKIDHRKGKTNNLYNGNWDNSTSGINAKDVSDAVCQFIWGAKQFDYLPITVYEEENEMCRDDSKVLVNHIDKVWDEIHRAY